MPFESEKQRRFMWAEHPEIARKWAHEGYAEGGQVMDDTSKQPAAKPAAPHGAVAAILLRMKHDPHAPGKEAPADPSAVEGSPDEEAHDKSEGENVNPDLKAASEDLVSAMQSKDPDSIAKTFQAMFDICMSYKDSDSPSDDQE